jgi:hypothetical protein
MSNTTPAPVRPLRDPRIYPCAKCGVMRSKSEGGTTFTVCDDCWENQYKSEAMLPVCAPPQPESAKETES